MGASGTGKLQQSILFPGSVTALVTDALRLWSNFHTHFYFFWIGSYLQFWGRLGLTAGVSYWLGLGFFIYMRKDLWVPPLRD